MSLQFEGPAVFVSDMAAARDFYENVLGQEVLFAVADTYTAYKNRFSLWQHQAADMLITGTEPAGPPSKQGRDNFELYFETETLETTWELVRSHCPEPIHAIREMPWGQRCFRIKDPDDHIVEIGEPMPLVIKRFLDQGLPPEDVAERTMAPLEMVKAMMADS